MKNGIRSLNPIAWVFSLLAVGLLPWFLTGCVQPRSHARYRAPDREPEQRVSLGIQSTADFYEPLNSYGRWEIVGAYGRCWIPGRVEADWRPYSNGYWQNTEAGWYWESDEPWGWATYHYGRWGFSSRIGWYWMPLTQWAPAWVSWHQGGGYVAWAPLNPLARTGRGGVVEVDVRVIAPRAYVVVEERRFLEPVRPNTVVVNNTAIINKTVNITKIKVVNNTVINEGPRTTVIEQASGRKVQAVPVRELRNKREAAIVAPAVPRPIPSPTRTAADSPVPVTKKQADRQQRATDLIAEEQAQQDKVRLSESARVQREAEQRAQAQRRAQQADEKRAADLIADEQAQQDKVRLSENARVQHEAEERAQAQRRALQADEKRAADLLIEERARQHQTPALESNSGNRQNEKRMEAQTQKELKADAKRDAQAEKKAAQETKHPGKDKRPAPSPDGTNSVSNVHEPLQ